MRSNWVWSAQHERSGPFKTRLVADRFDQGRCHLLRRSQGQCRHQRPRRNHGLTLQHLGRSPCEAALDDSGRHGIDRRGGRFPLAYRGYRSADGHHSLKFTGGNGLPAVGLLQGGPPTAERDCHQRPRVPARERSLAVILRGVAAFFLLKSAREQVPTGAY